MSDELIVEAYHRQVETDPERARYYLRCLRSIGNWRDPVDGAAINVAVAKAYSEGKFADDEITNAYNYFHLNHLDTSLTDEYIIGAFRSRLGDTPDSREARKYLGMIGQVRESDKIMSAAEDSKYQVNGIVELARLGIYDGQ